MGYDDAVAETARLTDSKVELTEDETLELNANLKFHIHEYSQLGIEHRQKGRMMAPDEIQKYREISKVFLIHKSMTISTTIGGETNDRQNYK